MDRKQQVGKIQAHPKEFHEKEHAEVKLPIAEEGGGRGMHCCATTRVFVGGTEASGAWRAGGRERIPPLLAQNSFTSRLCCHHASRHCTVCPYASVAQRAQPWRRRSDLPAAVSPRRGHVEAAAPRCYSSPAAAETGCGVSLHSAVVCSCSLSPAPPAPRPLRTPAPCHSLPPTVLCHRTRVKELQCLSPCLCSPVVTVAASMAAAASASASSVARSVLALLKTVARDVLAVLAVVAFFLTPVAALPYTRAYVPNTYTLINSNCSAWALRILTWLLLLPGTVSVVSAPQTTFRWESPFFDRKYRL
ncbi:hypothetical protein MRX96_042604 [Rhipicephalus microplus]